MIVMRVKLDNLCQFNDFDVNFSYPKKIVDSTIEGEYLKDRPNFRYKKLIVIMGQNASGKTTFGKILMALFNAMKTRDFGRLGDMISDRAKEANALVELVLHTNTLYRFEVKIKMAPQESLLDVEDSEEEEDFIPDPYIVSYCLKKCPINKSDNYEKCVDKLDNLATNFTEDLSSLRKEQLRMGWFFAFTKDEKPMSTVRFEKAGGKDLYLTALSTVLTTLDSSVEKVEWSSVKAEQDEDVILISFKNMSRKVWLLEHGIIGGDILSSGTAQAIEVAAMMASALDRIYRFYYCDEKFSYLQTEFETAVLSFLIECLDDRDQLFFTTHNYEVLDMALPKHSYLFFKKYINEDIPNIKAIFADSVLKKNTESLRHAYENDLFSVLPSTDAIFDLLERGNK